MTVLRRRKVQSGLAGLDQVIADAAVVGGDLTMEALPARPRPRRLGDLLAWGAWILEDDGRTRRLLWVLYPVAAVVVIVVLVLAAVMVFLPLVGAAIGGLLSWPAVVVVRRWRRPD